MVLVCVCVGACLDVKHVNSTHMARLLLMCRAGGGREASTEPFLIRASQFFFFFRLCLCGNFSSSKRFHLCQGLFGPYFGVKLRLCFHPLRPPLIANTGTLSNFHGFISQGCTHRPIQNHSRFRICVLTFILFSNFHAILIWNCIKQW